MVMKLLPDRILRWNVAMLAIVLALMLLLPAKSVLANNRPVANAGEVQTVYLGDNVYLLGTATDDDGDEIESWEWVWKSRPPGSTAELDDPNVPGPAFTPDVAGDYLLGLTVTDYMSESLPDALVIHVIENQTPIAVIQHTMGDWAPCTDPRNVGFDCYTVNFDGTQSSDPEQGPLTYLWDFGDGSFPSEDSAPGHEYMDYRTKLVSLLVTDERNAQGSASVWIEIPEPLNHPPVASARQTVAIPLNPAQNKLRLQVDGVRDDGKTATDRDMLTFIVP
jgi:hypothetical protein